MSYKTFFHELSSINVEVPSHMHTDTCTLTCTLTHAHTHHLSRSCNRSLHTSKYLYCWWEHFINCLTFLIKVQSNDAFHALTFTGSKRPRNKSCRWASQADLSQVLMRNFSSQKVYFITKQIIPKQFENQLKLVSILSHLVTVRMIKSWLRLRFKSLAPVTTT